MPKKIKKVVYEENLYSVTLRGDVWYAQYKDPNTKAYFPRLSLGLRQSDGNKRIHAEMEAERRIKGGIVDELLLSVEKRHSAYFEAYARGFFDKNGKYQMQRISESRTLKESTLDAYRGNLETFIMPFFKDFLLRSITKADAIRFRAYLLVEKKLNPRTAKNIFVNFKTILASAVEDGLLGFDPAQKVSVSVPKRRKKIGDIPSHGEIKRLLSIRWADNRAKMAVKIALNTGCRRGEVQALRWSDIEFHSNSARVFIRRSWNSEYGFTTTKTGEERIAYLGSKVTRDLKAYRKICLCSGNDDLIFASDVSGERPIDAKRLDWHLHSALSKIGIDEAMRRNRSLTFHKLRHYFITSLHEKGVSPLTIRKIVGHSDDDIEYVYFHGSGEEVVGCLDAVI